MKNRELKMKIENDICRLISVTSAKKIDSKAKVLHSSILKRHYNATDVTIDYFRKRIVMDLVIDDTVYNPKTANTSIPTFKANFFYLDLEEFLKSCITSDDKSIAFYSNLLRSLNFLDEQHKLLKTG